MLQLRVSRGAQEISHCIVQKVPFTIGKSPTADLCLEAAGVWDVHVSLELDQESGKFKASALDEALLLVNGESCRTAFLKSGDLLQLGGCHLSVTLSPAEQRELTIQEFSAWALLFLVTILEIALIAVLR